MAEVRAAVVSCHNEWDPLEEVVVGVAEGGVVNPWEPGFEAMIPEEYLPLVREHHLNNAGMPFTDEQVELARQEIDEFVHILEAEGIVVRRPDIYDQSAGFATPWFSSPAGNGQYNPRDVMTVIGGEIIESTMGWRSRYFEYGSFRRLVKEYFKKGARWTASPKGQYTDALYKPDHRRGANWEWVTTEFEPVWDAADLVRCGRDIFFQRSHTSNEFAINWLQRHLGEGYRVHQVEFRDDRAVHIDATMMPIAPGKMLVNPDRPMKDGPVLEMIKKAGWELLPCPRTTYPKNHPSFRSFEWLVMNIISLDEKRIVIEKQEEPFAKALRDWGFEPIPVAYRNCYKHGGSFHCSTLDVRRRGTLESYF